MIRSLPLGLYVHIPWCVRKCPYCDFNSHAGSEKLPESAYIDALLRDLEQSLPPVRERTLETLFIGGGTPSLFRAESIARLLEGIRARIDCSPAIEITLEANPGTAEIDQFTGFRQAGINRLSIGVQSFEEAKLRQLGRIHGRDEAIRAGKMARQAGLDNFNLDLMFGLPDQTPEEAMADVRQAIALEPTHLSFYQLTLEPNTLFHKYPPKLPDEDRIGAMQESAQTLLADQGYGQYEVSAYSQAGKRCRHNLNYWCFGDYLGIGAGAHGKITDPESGTIRRTWKIKHPLHYLGATGQPERQGGVATVAPQEIRFEFLMNALRLREGFPIPLLEERTRLDPEALEPELSRCVADGLLAQEGRTIRCTPTGYNFLDSVLQRFIQTR